MTQLLTHVRAIEQYNPIRVGCVLYLPLWHPYLNRSRFLSVDRYRRLATVTGAVHKPPEGEILDGTDDIISIPDAPSLSTLGPITIIAWFKGDDVTENTGLVSKDSGAVGGREFLLRQVTSQVGVMFLSSTGATAYLEAVSTTTLSNSVWYHAAVTWNGTNATGNINIYLNGVLEVLTTNLKSEAGAVPYDGAYAVEIGRFASDNAYCFDGVIGEVWIFSRALTVGEISHIYQATKWRYV